VERRWSAQPEAEVGDETRVSKKGGETDKPNLSLRYLRDQPNLLHPDATDAHLTLWAFEDWLKKYFFSLLQVLEVRHKAFKGV
jgi:hypothetical protein